MPVLNEVSAKQEAIRRVIHDAREAEDKTIMGAAITQAKDLNEDALVNVTLAFMQTQFQEEPRQGHVFQAMAMIDYLDSLGMKVTWKEHSSPRRRGHRGFQPMQDGIDYDSSEQ